MRSAPPQRNAGVPELLGRAGAALGVELCPHGVRVDDTGWDFLVLHADDVHGRSWIVRSARHPAAAGRLDVEAVVLPLVRDRVGIGVPDWRARAAGLVVYPRLPGEPAGYEDPRTLEYRWSAGPVAPAGGYPARLARALLAVHDTPAGSVRGLPGVPDVRRDTAVELARAGDELPLPPADVRRWRAWLDDDRYWPAPVLVHGDVHPGHTLVRDRPGGPVLTGLLDWANATLDDPAADFVDMYLAGGEALLGPILDGYRAAGGADPGTLPDRVRARASFRWVHVALRGLDEGRPHLVDVALERIRRRGTR